MTSRSLSALLLLFLPQLICAQNFALEFDGIDDRVDIAPIGAYDFGANDFSVEATVKFDDLNIHGAVVTAWTANSCSQVGWGIMPENTGVLRFYIGDGSSNCPGLDLVSTSVLTTGQCYHVAGVKQGSTMRLYLDGVLVDTNTTARVLTGNIPVRIGNRYANAPTVGLHDGTIEEVRIWNQARSQADIQTFMHSSLAGNESGLVGYWPLNDGAGGIALDLSPNANHGTLVNMDVNNAWVAPCATRTVVPTLSDWGLIILALVLLCLGGIMIGRQAQKRRGIHASLPEESGN